MRPNGRLYWRLIVRLLCVGQESISKKFIVHTIIEYEGEESMDEATTHLRLLRHKDASVRITAIKALGKLDPVDSIIIDSLARTLEDNDPSVREAAAQVLGEISNRQIQTSISGTEKRNNPALSRLVHIVLHDTSVK